MRSDDLHHILKSMEKVSLQYTDDGSDVSNAEEIEKFKAMYGDGFPNDDFCQVVKMEVEKLFSMRDNTRDKHVTNNEEET